MSVLQKLTEGVQQRDMQAEGAALLNKWEATGLLEGLGNSQQKQGMAVLLENQAKELLREASSMAAGDVEGFAAVAFPIVRRVFGGLIANDLISVQPMSLPSGLIFFLDFTHESARGGFAADSSLYGGGVVGKEIIDGVKDIAETGFYGLRTGYAAASGSIQAATPDTVTVHADGSKAKEVDYDPDLLAKVCVAIKGDVTAASAGHALQEMDPGAARAMQLTGFTAGAAAGIDGTAVAAVVISGDDHAALTDADERAAVQPGDLVLQVTADAGASILGHDVLNTNEALIHLRPRRRLSSLATSTNDNGLKEIKAVDGLDRFVFELLSVDDLGVANHGDAVANTGAAATALANPVRLLDLTDADARAHSEMAELGEFLATCTFVLSIPVRDEINAVGLGAIRAGSMPLEEPDDATGNQAAGRAGKMDIAEIDIKVDSVAVTAQTKKLKAKWSPELGQDLNAYHNLDAEVELTGILSEQIALEIDRELLGELVDGATAGTRYWSRAPGLFVDADGQEVGFESAAPDFTGTVSEWYETLIETINDVSAQIHRKTLRGGANFVVCSPEVANILEFTSGFRASVTADQDRGTIGAIKAGSLSKKFDVYVDPYFLRNVILVGRKGSSFLESGYVYAPYVPLQVTPTIFGTEDFVPRKGVMTRYAKKMVRPDMYGLVVVRGLLGESGRSQ